MSSDYFYDKNNFAYLTLLESNYSLIKEELSNLLNNDSIVNLHWTDAHPHYVKSSANLSWKTFEFVFFGIKQLENAKLCPKTSEIINQIPELVTAQFSILYPNTHVQPHTGYSRIVLRNHLPLIVPPNNQCGLRIENQTHYWKEGELVVFDDSFLHEAWNNSNELRAVLMFDVAKPNCGYSASQICNYKIDTIDDPFLLDIAPKNRWKEWLKQGFFD